VAVTFDGGEKQEDTFTIHVLPRADVPLPEGKIALYDPLGETAALLKGLGVKFKKVRATSSLSGFDLLIVGKHALTLDERGPDLKDGPPFLNVLVFEQKPEVLERRLGFRTATYGLRRVFPRVPDHPMLAGIDPEHLRDWRGEATTVPPRLDYEMRPRHGPTVEWCGIPVTRLWRCGNRGNVATALIEKPGTSDFLPILDGGFSLQYSPLLLYRDGSAAILFCQLDVTGRTMPEPAAERLVRNMLREISVQKGAMLRTPVYAGAGRRCLRVFGPNARPFEPGKLEKHDVLVAGPGAGEELGGVRRGTREAIASWIRRGGHVLALGLDEKEARTFLPGKVRMTKAEHIATYFEPQPTESPLAGISPADVHNRDPRTLDLVTGGAEVFGNGVLAVAEKGHVVYCQLAPWDFTDHGQFLSRRRTFRRASFLVARLLANLGCAPGTLLRQWFAEPPGDNDRRWLRMWYEDEPIEWDDPYRFFRW
jgi:hypothetical protein